MNGISDKEFIIQCLLWLLMLPIGAGIIFLISKVASEAVTSFCSFLLFALFMLAVFVKLYFIIRH